MKVQHLLPADIERTSMQIIEEELARQGVSIPENNAAVVRRVIHTTADFDFAKTLRFTPDAVEKGIDALQRGVSLVTDTNMALAGISKPSLKLLQVDARCYMASPEVVAAARENGTTRAVASMQYAATICPDGVFAIGNAPTALLALSTMIEERRMHPSLVVAVPVGFVNVVESKERLFAVCEKEKIPCIAAMGRKGGSTVAAAICNALLYTATGRLDPAARGWQG